MSRLLFEYGISRIDGRDISQQEVGGISGIIFDVVFGGPCGPLLREGVYCFNFYYRFNPNKGEGRHTMNLLGERLQTRGYKIKKIH